MNTYAWTLTASLPPLFYEDEVVKKDLFFNDVATIPY